VTTNRKNQNLALEKILRTDLNGGNRFRTVFTDIPLNNIVAILQIETPLGWEKLWSCRKVAVSVDAIEVVLG
jgi:hypothetical protein